MELNFLNIPLSMQKKSSVNMLSKIELENHLVNLQTKVLNDLRMLLGDERDCVSYTALKQTSYQSEPGRVAHYFLTVGSIEIGTIRLSKSYDLRLLFDISQKHMHTPFGSEHYVTFEIMLSISFPSLPLSYLASSKIQALSALSDLFESDSIRTFKVCILNAKEAIAEMSAYQQQIDNVIFDGIQESLSICRGNEFNIWCRNGARNKTKAFVLDMPLNIDTIIDYRAMNVRTRFSNKIVHNHELYVNDSLRKLSEDGLILRSFKCVWRPEAPSTVWMTRL